MSRGRGLPPPRAVAIIPCTMRADTRESLTAYATRGRIFPAPARRTHTLSPCHQRAPCHVSSRLLSTGSGRSRDASPASSLYPRRFSSSTTCCLLTDCGMTITKPLCQQVTRQICARVCARDLTGCGDQALGSIALQVRRPPKRKLVPRSGTFLADKSAPRRS